MFVDNTIVYKHNKTVKFNWRGYGDGLSDKQIKTIKDSIVLPEGYNFA